MKKRLHSLTALMMALVMLLGSMPAIAEESIPAEAAPEVEVTAVAVQAEPEAPAAEGEAIEGATFAMPALFAEEASPLVEIPVESLEINHYYSEPLYLYGRDGSDYRYHGKP